MQEELPIDMGGALPPGRHEVVIDDCGYPVGTFACKIRHIQINTGDAKADEDRRERERATGVVEI